MDIAMQVHFAYFHVDVVKIIRRIETAMAKNINNVFVAAIFFTGHFKSLDGPYLIYDVVTRKSRTV